MNRAKTVKKIDEKIFTRTAKQTKLCNVLPTIMRGGTRL